MASFLDSIKAKLGFLAPTGQTVQRIESAASTAGNLALDAAQKFASFAVKNPVTTLGPAGVAAASKTVQQKAAGLAKDIVQGTARSGASVGLQATNAVGKTIAGPGFDLNTVSPQDFSSQTAQKFATAIFGNEPIKSTNQRIIEAIPKVQAGADYVANKAGVDAKLGAGPASLIAAPAILGLTALDFTGGSGEKKAVQEGVEQTGKLVKLAEQGAFNAAGKEIFKNARLPEEVLPKLNYTLPKEKGVIKKAGETINSFIAPIKNLDSDTQDILRAWNTGRITARETANQAFTAAKIEAPKGVQTLVDYSKGVAVKGGEDIKAAFDNLFEKAQSLGFEPKYRENYLPQVYANKPEEVRRAVAKFMADKGVDETVINGYLKGTGEIPEKIADALKLTPSFTHGRAFPDYATALEYGLKPRFTDPKQLVGFYEEQLGRVAADSKLVRELLDKGKIVVDRLAPNGWKYINIPLLEGYKAEPSLARTLEGIMRDEANLSVGERVVQNTAAFARRTQDAALSGGAPKTTLNMLVARELAKSAGTSLGHAIQGDVGGAYREIKSAIIPALRANSDTFSLRFLNKPEIQQAFSELASEGIDYTRRIGSYDERTIKEVFDSEGVRAALGHGWDELFNKKTFGSFGVQQGVTLYSETKKSLIAAGLTEQEARQRAVQIVRGYNGITTYTARSRFTRDLLSTVFFAPPYREGIINFMINNIKSVTTEIRNPALYKNRSFVIGALATYGIYNAINHELNGHFMWDNENGKEFELRIPLENGQVAFTPMFPSLLAFPRNMVSGAIGAATGDWKTATQKFGSLFSIPLALTSETLSNRDYFGRAIYGEGDPTNVKIQKVAAHWGLQVSQPIVREVLKQVMSRDALGKGVERNVTPNYAKNLREYPIYQSVLSAMEIPIRFMSKEDVSRSAFYEAMDKKKQERDALKRSVQPIYDHIQQLVNQDKNDEASALIEGMSDDEFAIYKDILTSKKTADTKRAESEVYGKYKQIQQLVNQDKPDEASAIISGMTDDEFQAYQKLINLLK